MDRTRNPNVGADNSGNGGGDGDGGDDKPSPTEEADAILSAFGMATGNKVVPIKKTA